MAILLYCIAKRDVQGSGSLTGVAGHPVLCTQFGTLTTFTSCDAGHTAWLQKRLQASALEFHHVLNQVFKSGAIIPFRFPTIFESEKDLAEHLQDRSREYNAWLEKFRDVVQMEIRITNSGVKTHPASGAQYLKERRSAIHAIEKFESELRSHLSLVLKDWRNRVSKDGVRAFALVDRQQVEGFGKIMHNAWVPEGMKVRVSGPWPVSEFLEQS